MKRDGFGLGFFTTLTIGAWYMSFDYGYNSERKPALICLGLFLVLAVAACHFLLKLLERTPSEQDEIPAEQPIDTDEAGDESGEAVDAASSTRAPIG